MKHVVIVGGWIYPNPSPTGNCIKNIIQELNGDYEISVICFKDNDEYNSILVDNINYYFVDNFRLKLRRIALTGLTSKVNKFQQYLCNILMYISKFIRVCFSLFAWPTSEYWYINKSIKLLEIINSEKTIDTIITVSNPFEAHVCGYKYKKKNSNINWITYTLDHFATSKSLNKYFVNKRIKFEIDKGFERKILTSADYNFITHELDPWFQEVTKGSSENIEAISFPLLILNSYDDTTNYFKDYKDKINLVYAGALYSEIRNPEYLFKLISNTQNDSIVLHLFVKGDCDQLVNKYSQSSSNRIIAHDTLTLDEIHIVMEQTDILVNIGNNIIDQKPSKIYEYIATGKPIINIHYEKIDYHEIFKHYPLTLNINQDFQDYNNDVERIIDFCTMNRSKSIDKNHVFESFIESTPGFIANKFKKYI